MSTSAPLVRWSDGVWSSAKMGDVEALDTLFAAAPTSVAPLAAEWARVQTMKRTAELSLEDRATRILDDLDRDDGAPDIDSVLELVDLRSTGLREPLDHRAGTRIDAEIERWTNEAERSAADGRSKDASRAWVRVSELADDKRHPRLQILAMDRASRAIGGATAGGDSGVLSWYDIERVLLTLLELHVDAPRWRPLVQAGLDAAVNACRDAEGRIPDSIASLQRRFSTEIAGLPDGTTMPGGLERPLRRLCSGWWSDYLSEQPEETRPDLIACFINGMFGATDPRSRAYIGRDADRFRDQFSESYLGVGTEIVVTVDGMRLRPLPGGPAKRAGIRDGDILVSVDGVDVTDLPLVEVVRRIQGPRLTFVDIEVAGVDRTPLRTVRVPRDDVHRVSVHGWRQEGMRTDGTPSWDWIIDDRAGIAYVSIRDFLPSMGDRFRAAMRDANGQLGPGRQVQGLILDLRGDPGGDRETTEDLLDLFLDDGPLLLAEDQSGTLDGRRATRRRTRLRGLPVVVMIDEGSASASEILAGTLQGEGNAVVVGERSFGKGSVQRLDQRGDVLMVVTQSWFHVPTRTGDHRPIDRFRSDTDWGLHPDLTVPATDEEGRTAINRRSAWYSGVGQDLADSEADDDFVAMQCADRTLLESLTLLQARLAPITNSVSDGS